MPTSRGYWLIASPLDGNASEMLSDLKSKLDPSHSLPGTSAKLPSFSNENSSLSSLKIPEFKTASLSSLLSLSDSLNKLDSTFLSIVAKIVDTIRQLDPNSVDRNLVMDDGRPYDEYITAGWSWNKAKYRAEGRPLEDLVDSFQKDMSGLDVIHRQKQGNYNLARGQLQTLLRKQTGNLTTRDLSTVIDKDEAPAVIKDSEYLDIVYVAVPKNNHKEWENKYERLAPMVVPRSSMKVASDDEFNLYTATIFKKHKDEFAQKCRENKFTLREFAYDEEAIKKQQTEIKELQASERELYTELMRISRINFSEGVELLVHLKVIRAYIECLLRYGLPASYFYAFVKPDPKTVKKLLPTLVSFFAPFTPKQTLDKKNKKSGQIDDSILGEYANVMEQEIFDFVLFDLPLAEDLDSSSR